MTEKIRDYSVNGAMIIGVDNGYGNMKTARRCFKTALAKYDSEPVLSGDYLEYDGKVLWQISSQMKIIIF